MKVKIGCSISYTAVVRNVLVIVNTNTVSQFRPYLGELSKFPPSNHKNFTKFADPSRGISYQVGDLCRRFTQFTGLSADTLHSNPIPTDCTNGLILNQHRLNTHFSLKFMQYILIWSYFLPSEYIVPLSARSMVS